MEAYNDMGIVAFDLNEELEDEKELGWVGDKELIQSAAPEDVSQHGSEGGFDDATGDAATNGAIQTVHFECGSPNSDPPTPFACGISIDSPPTPFKGGSFNSGLPTPFADGISIDSPPTPFEC